MTSFPFDIIIFNKIVEVFNQTRSYVLLLFPLAFFIRIAFGFIFLKAESFTEILKDSLFLFLGLFFFTDILKLTLQIPFFVSSELSTEDFKNINLGQGIFTKALKRLVEWIGIITYWISFGLYVVVVSILGFFAGYILFFGTMFRAYGLLKVFFILLLIASLWPLLWHSINFAVLTIAVSDNAFANNVIIGGASVAKVFVPLWLISKASKLPVNNTLKKVSLAGGGLAFTAGSYASSLINLSQNSKSKQETNQEITSRQTEISLSEIEEKNSPFTTDEDYLNNPADDFSFSQTEPKSLELQNSKANELHFEEESQNNIKTSSLNEKTINEKNQIKTEQTISEETSNSQNSAVVTESQNLNSNNKDISIENETQSINETTPSDFSNESVLNKSKSFDTELSNSNLNSNLKSETFNEEVKEKREKERDN